MHAQHSPSEPAVQSSTGARSRTPSARREMASARRWLCLILAAAAAAAASGAPAPEDDPGMPMAARHRCWMARVGRTYADAAEKARRFEVFRANAERIDAANRAGDLTYTLGLTPFADLTADEFRARHLMPDADVDEPATARVLFEQEEKAAKQHLPPSRPPAVWGSKDWRDLGAVTPVQDQDKNNCSKHQLNCFINNENGLYLLSQ